MLPARRCLANIRPRSWTLQFRRQLSKSPCKTDSLGIPLVPTWSVNELLSLYPTPTITSATLERLHELSALTPPAEGTLAHETLKRELEELVRLVEAVKLVKLDGDGQTEQEAGVPDGRIWAKNVGLQMPEQSVDHEDVNGRELLRYAARVSNDGLYVVDSDRRRS